MLLTRVPAIVVAQVTVVVVVVVVVAIVVVTIVIRDPWLVSGDWCFMIGDRS